MTRVLLVDDDVEMCELLSEYLAGEGFEVALEHEGTGAAARAVEGSFDLVILDVMLPGLSGFDVLRRLKRSSSVPVIMLTARGDEVDRIVGLEIGADDYLPKPFNPRELVARARAVLRRVEATPATADAPSLLRLDDLELDVGARQVFVAGREVGLTGVELELLRTLAESAGRVVGRDDLSRAALGRRTSSYDRSLDVHISNLRRKLGPGRGGSERIKTVRGVGYLYVRPAR